MMRSALSLRVRLCPSWPGLAPPGFDFSRCSLRSVEGGFEDVREVFSGRCRRSTKSISSSLLRRSSSLRPIPPFNQSKQRDARAWVIAAWENGYCESFNGKLRDECLKGEIFYSLKEAQVII